MSTVNLNINLRSLIHALEPKSGIQKTLATITRKIMSITISIFKAMVGIGLYWATPTTFAIGFLVGIVADQKIAEVARKIQTIWKNQPAWVCVSLAIGCYLSLPVTIAAGSFLYGAKLGSSLTQSSLAKEEQILSSR